ncbi:MAG TPA: tripartite tricarboxylate transporter substrate-binding protein [Beijerinckiaceae bacterium]|nr:tripartite tricarboxylate transporter substrate-binding protein [Beijerinckiaceae bacterium]
MTIARTILAVAGLAAVIFAGTANGQDFYQGKQLQLIVGNDPGAGYDAYARLLSRHLSQHIPGQPAIVIQNRPGAGGLQAANYLYNLAPKDGTVISTFQRNLPLMSIVEKDNKQVRYDATKFTWLGSASSGAGDAYLLIVRSDVPVQNIAETHLPGGRQIVLAGSAPGTQGYDVPAMLAQILDLNLKTIVGYPSAAEMSLALMRKEVDGRMIGLSALRSTQPDWLANHRIRVLLQVGRADRHPDLPDVPLAHELATNPEDLTLIKVMGAAQTMSWPFLAPPDVPADRAAILQKAFMDTQNDPDYVADAEQQKMELSPIGGDAIKAMLRDLDNSLTPALLARYNAIIAKTKDGAR